MILNGAPRAPFFCALMQRLTFWLHVPPLLPLISLKIGFGLIPRVHLR